MVTLENLAPRRVPRKPQYESKFLFPLVTARIAEPHLLSLRTSLANVLRTVPFVSCARSRSPAAEPASLRATGRLR